MICNFIYTSEILEVVKLYQIFKIFPKVIAINCYFKIKHTMLNLKKSNVLLSSTNKYYQRYMGIDFMVEF